MSRRTIAIVDDDRISSFVIQRMFESTECSAHVVCYAGGRALLNHMQEHVSEPDELPDLITLDINMPISTGWEVLKELEVLLPSLSKTPVIYMLSSSTDPKDADMALHSPIVERYMIKPVSREMCTYMLQANG